VLNQPRMDAGHYPIMVCSSANIANHDVPGFYLAVHDTPVRREIALAARHEVHKRYFFRQAAPACVQDAHDTSLAGSPGNKFDLPNALAVIAPVLLEDTRACRLEP
jgi:hypothetical protein